MSRILAVTLVVSAGPALAAEPADPVLARYAEATRVSVQCARDREQAIVVCGRRAADKWRVPFLGYAAGDPRGEDVSTERNRLASEPKPTCGVTAFFATSNCGMVGVSVSTRIGGDSVRLRPLAD